MLREIKHPHLNPRLVGLTALTLVTPGITPGFGSTDFTSPGSVVRAAAGEMTMVSKRKYQRSPIQVCAIGANGTIGSFAVNKVIPTVTGSSVQHRGPTGTAATAESQLYMLQCGYDAATTNINTRQRLMSSRRKMRLFGCKVNTTVTAAINIGSNQFKSIVRNGTGDVTLTFRRPFALPPIVIPTGFNPGATAIKSPRVAAVSTTAVQITLGNESGNPVDGSFDLFVYGTDYGVETATLFRNVVQGCQRQERFHCGRITVSGAAIQSTVGDFTCVRNGVGDFTFTAPTARPLMAFGREPLIVASSDVVYTQLKAASAASFQLLTTVNAVATDPGVLDYMVLGSEVAQEFGGY